MPGNLDLTVQYFQWVGGGGDSTNGEGSPIEDQKVSQRRPKFSNGDMIFLGSVLLTSLPLTRYLFLQKGFHSERDTVCG